MEQSPVPFAKNLKDDLHCFQAALKMVLGVLDPKTRYSYRALDAVTGFKKGNVTWDTQALLWLANQGFEVAKVTPFDYVAFAHRGATYLRDFWRADVFAFQDAHSDLRREKALAKGLLKNRRITLESRRPTLRDMEDCIKKGWLAIVNVDVALLDKKKRYSPHSIVVTKLAPRFVEFHDPGLPPEPSRRVPRALFAKALHQAELVLLRWPLPRG